MVGADRDDIMQEGMIGIFKAIKRLRPRTGLLRFHTFAELCINRQIITAIKQATRRKHSPLNTSVSLSKPVSEEQQAVTLAETLPTDSDSDPESLSASKGSCRLSRRKRAGFLQQLSNTWYGKSIFRGKAMGRLRKVLVNQQNPLTMRSKEQRGKIAVYLAKSR